MSVRLSNNSTLRRCHIHPTQQTIVGVRPLKLRKSGHIMPIPPSPSPCGLCLSRCPSKQPEKLTKTHTHRFCTKTKVRSQSICSQNRTEKRTKTAIERLTLTYEFHFGHEFVCCLGTRNRDHLWPQKCPSHSKNDNARSHPGRPLARGRIGLHVATVHWFWGVGSRQPTWC